MAESGSAWEKAGQAKKKRSRKRLVLGAITVLFLLIVVGLILAPTIASPFVRGMVASKGSEAVPGTIDARSVGLSWFGPQQVQGLTIVDPDGSTVADVTVQADVGLLGLVFGSRDLGTITVSGQMNIEKNDEGELNLLQALTKPKSSSTGSSSGSPSGTGTASSGSKGGLPPSLQARIEFDNLRVAYADATLRERGVSTMAIESITGHASIAVGAPIDINLKGTIAGEGHAADTFKSGTFDIDATINNLIDNNGIIQTENAVIEGTVESSDLDPRLLDRLSDAPVAFEQAFGSFIDLTARVQGALTKPGLHLSLSSKHVSAGGAIGFDLDDLVIAEPLTVTISQAAMSAIDPVWLAEVTGGSLDIRSMPSLAASVNSARIPLTGASLAALNGNVTVDLGAIDAAVTIGEGEEAATRQITTAPATVRLETASLAEGATIKGALDLTVDGRAGGSVGVDIEATEFLDDAGALRTSQLPVLRGTLGLVGVDTAVLQPFVAAAGVNLKKEVGPTVSMGVDLEPQAGGAISLVKARIESDNINGELNLALEDMILRAGDPGGQIRVASLGPLLTRQFHEQGLRVREGARIEMSLYALSADLTDALAGDGLAATDVDGIVEVILGPTSGVILVDGSGKSFEIEQLSAFVELAGSTKAVQIRVATGGRFNNQPAGQISAEFRLSGMIGETGTFGMPRAVAGRAEFIGVSTQIVEPFIQDPNLRPTALVGPTVDLILEASRIDHDKTKLVATLSSEKLTGDGAFLFSEESLEVDPVEGYTLTHTGLAAPLANLIEMGEHAQLRSDGGSTEIRLSRLFIPLDKQTRSLHLDETDLAMRIAVRNVYIDSNPTSAIEQTELRQVVFNTRLRPDEDATVRIGSTLYAGQDKIQGDGEFAIPGLSAALAGTGAWTLPALAPQGAFTIAELPASLLAMGIDMAQVEGLNAGLLASDIAGEAIELRLGIKPDNNFVRTDLTATGTRLNLTGHALFGESLVSTHTEGEIKLSRPSAEHLMRTMLPEMAETVAISGTTALRFGTTTTAGGPIEAHVLIPALTMQGLEPDDVRFRVEADVSTDAAAQSNTIKLATIISDSERNEIGRIDADLQSTEATGMNGTVAAQGLKPAWLDQMLGSTDLYAGLLGTSAGLNGEISTTGGVTSISGLIDAPTLSNASAISIELAQGAIVLTEPFRANWRGDRAWLNNRLSRSLEEQSLTLAQDLLVDLRVRSLAVPPRAERSNTNFAVDMTARVEELDITLPGGEQRAYRQLQVVARHNDDATGARVTMRGDVRIGEGEPQRALNVTADIVDLAEPGLLTADKAYVNVNGRIQHVPTSVIDAFAGTNGLLVKMLGSEVSIDELVANRAPLEGGTVIMKFSSPSSRAHIAGSFQDARADGVLQDGAFVLDQGGYIELTSLNQSFTKEIFNVVPLFGEIKRTPGQERASRIDIRSGSIPLAASIEGIAFDISADLGSVNYGLGGPITEVLKITGQNSFGQIGARITPFNVRMDRGIIDYDSLSVPLGEFAFTSEGTINLISQTKDLLVNMPTGAFAAEAFGTTGPLGRFLDEAATIPMTNKGALDAKPWKPDFSKAFKPGKILENTVRDGFSDLLKPKGDKPTDGVGPGGGGG